MVCKAVIETSLLSVWEGHAADISRTLKPQQCYVLRQMTYALYTTKFKCSATHQFKVIQSNAVSVLFCRLAVVLP
jgi:hypothetical protein